MLMGKRQIQTELTERHESGTAAAHQTSSPTQPPRSLSGLRSGLFRSLHDAHPEDLGPYSSRRWGHVVRLATQVVILKVRRSQHMIKTPRGALLTHPHLRRLGLRVGNVTPAARALPGILI